MVRASPKFGDRRILTGQKKNSTKTKIGEYKLGERHKHVGEI